jgi:hypothetical protein
MLMNSPRWYRSRWFMPAFSVSLGLLMGGALLAGDNAGGAIWSVLLMTGVGALFFFGGRRSETLAGLGGPGRDERWELIDVRATSFAGTVLIALLIGCWLWNIGNGGDGSPYGQLMAVTGVAYIVGVAVLRRRG